MLLFCIVNLFGNLLYPLLKVTIVFRVFFCVKISFLIMCVGERERERERERENVYVVWPD